MKQLIMCSLLLITVLVYSQNNPEHPLKGTWYISMIGVNLKDTAIYQVINEKIELNFGNVLEQKVLTRYYTRKQEPSYIEYINGRNPSLRLYNTRKDRRKGSNARVIEYISEKDLVILIEPETPGISTEFGFPAYDKLTVITRTYDSLSWNKHILGFWKDKSSKHFFDLKTGDTCSFTKTIFQEENQLRFDLNSGFSTCKVKEKPSNIPIESNSVIDGVYMRNKWFSYRYGINLEKNELTLLLGSFSMSFKIIELTDGSLVLVKL